MLVLNGIKHGNPPRLGDTVWDDMVAGLFGFRLYSTAGKVNYDFDENTIAFASGGDIAVAADRVGANQEIKHMFKKGLVTFHPHIHWFQPSADAFTFTMRYRIQKNGQLKTTDWTTLTAVAGGASDSFLYPGAGVFTQITEFTPNITETIGLSDTIQFQMARTDVLGGVVDAFFLDMHGEIDSIGSELEYIKY